MDSAREEENAQEGGARSRKVSSSSRTSGSLCSGCTSPR